MMVRMRYIAARLYTQAGATGANVIVVSAG